MVVTCKDVYSGKLGGKGKSLDFGNSITKLADNTIFVSKRVSIVEQIQYLESSSE